MPLLSPGIAGRSSGNIEMRPDQFDELGIVDAGHHEDRKTPIRQVRVNNGPLVIAMSVGGQSITRRRSTEFSTAFSGTSPLSLKSLK